MRKHYEAPSMEVVALKLQGSLLAGSTVNNEDEIPEGNVYINDMFD